MWGPVWLLTGGAKLENSAEQNLYHFHCANAADMIVQTFNSKIPVIRKERFVIFVNN